MTIGGSRFLRKFAGIGAVEPKVEPKIESHLLGFLSQVFGIDNSKTYHLRTVAGLDIRPCDELPVIGPMFGETRILVASGFMNHGLPQGFFAGKCLSDLIQSGVCGNLPRILWPERLRSIQS